MHHRRLDAPRSGGSYSLSYEFALIRGQVIRNLEFNVNRGHVFHDRSYHGMCTICLCAEKVLVVSKQCTDAKKGFG